MGMVGTEVAGRGWEDVRKEHYAESQKQRTGRVALMLVISGCTGNRTPAARSRARPARISHAVFRALWERRANKPTARHPEDSQDVSRGVRRWGAGGVYAHARHGVCFAGA